MKHKWCLKRVLCGKLIMIIITDNHENKRFIILWNMQSAHCTLHSTAGTCKI